MFGKLLTRTAQTVIIMMLSAVGVLGFSAAAHSSPIVGAINAGLSGTGSKDIVAAGAKLFVLNGSDIKVIDTSVSPPTVSTISFSNPGLDGTLNKGVYVGTDQSVWVTSYGMGSSGTVREGGEVIRIDATTNTVTHRFCSRSSTGTCTLSSLEGAMGITTDGSNVYVAMQAFNDSRDSILVFDTGYRLGGPNVQPSRLANLAYTVVNSSSPASPGTDSPAWLAISGNILYIFQEGPPNTNANVVRFVLGSSPVAQTYFSTGVMSATFARTGPDGFVYFGNADIVKRIDAAGATTTVRSAASAGTIGVAFTPEDHPDGRWLFTAQTGGVKALLRSSPFTEVGSVSGLTNPKGVGVLGDYLYLATTPTVTQISLNPTIATSDRVLNLDTVSTIDSPPIESFWTSVVFESTTLPAGLTLDPSTGAISGTPTSVGDTVVTITARGSSMFTRSSSFTISVVGPTTPSPPGSADADPNKLAATGINSGTALIVGLIAAGLGLAGAASIVIARRKLT
ncbi:MAG: hypothetical protein F2808_05765 [Actinobacteria bacterium]|uniref:Unannotated protein n=1 Tax=freshwater metagenome TaxID=449393 RepID=A0A6J7GN91_9ZZZZ|nr:hypothetical protein [Actinomycetota bacterium]